MQILVILGNPGLGTFNHAIGETVVDTLQNNNHEVIFHDLYKENFDPVVQANEILQDGKHNKIINTHCKELANCDGIVIIHPNWWGQPPAIVKGWIDRVFRPGVAYEFLEGDSGEGVPVGLLKAQTAVVFNTSNTNEERENKFFHDPLEYIWKNCIFDLCGIKKFYRKMFRVVITSTMEQRKEWLNEVREIVDKYFP
jgi:NAD(P)H dehydrogenase (quinone)